MEARLCARRSQSADVSRRRDCGRFHVDYRGSRVSRLTVTRCDSTYYVEIGPLCKFKWWRGTESNCRHYDFQPTETRQLGQRETAAPDFIGVPANPNRPRPPRAATDCQPFVSRVLHF